MLNNKLQLLKVILTILLIGNLPSLAQSQTLKHSYDFESGDATDQTGNADGTLHGGFIENGRYTSSLPGNFISLPGDQIKINEYSSLTLEAYVQTPAGNGTNTMLAYFGRTLSSNNGADYLFLSAKNGGNTAAAISCNNTTNPWTTESKLTTTSLEDNELHHLVLTVDGSTMKLFVDGSNASTVTLSAQNKLSNLSNELIYLCKGGYTGDATWLGTIDAFNIYDGILSSTDILINSNTYISTARIISSQYGQINSKSQSINDVPEVSISDFMSGLSVPKNVTKFLLDAAGNDITNSSEMIQTGMQLVLSGLTDEIYDINVYEKSNQNLVLWAFDCNIDHELGYMFDLYEGLQTNQFQAALKISEKASVRLLDKSNNLLESNHIISNQDKVEVTAENGDIKSYTIFVKADVQLPDTTITDSNQSFFQLPTASYNLGDGVEWYILDGENPLHGSTINLTGEDVWVYFPEIKPQTLHDEYFDFITVDGATPQVDVNVRLVQYGNGCVLIGHSSSFQPLTVYANSDLSGDSKALGLYTYYKEADSYNTTPRESLGAFDDNIESFVLKKGYMATFSENTDGTGASKVYIADEEDIVLTNMEAGLVNSVSFIRVFPWRWVNRKGYVGNAADGQNAGSQWVYCHCDSWGEESSLNVEFVPLRHNPGWPSYGTIQSKRNMTHALFFNEPDNSVDDGYATVETAINQYPNLLASGLRMVSPAPTDGGAGWLFDFVAQCKAKNYRLDAVAIHFYRGCQTPQSFYDFLKYIHDNTGLPVWITEWNNGCNWSSSNCIPTSYEQQAAVIKDWVDMLEAATFVERYSIWPGCTQYQQFYMNDGTGWVLTPAGEIYRDKKSKLAYTSASEHNYRYAPQNNSTEIASKNLSWIPKGGTSAQLVHFGDTYPPKYVAQVSSGSNQFEIPPLEFGKTYYWRVDELNSNGSIVTGEELQFTSYNYANAVDPNPENAAMTSVSTDELTWTSDLSLNPSHVVYFGESDENLQLMGTLEAEQMSFSIQDLELEIGKTYYWRVDEIITVSGGTQMTGKGDVWSFTVSEILSAGEKSQIVIYPNPATDRLHISGLKSEAKIAIYDITGHQILTTKSDGRIDLPGLQSGVYFLHINGAKAAKFIIE